LVSDPEIKARVWVIDDDRSIRWVLEKALSQAGLDVTCFENADAVLARLVREQPQAIISDIRMPGTDGLALLDTIRERHPGLPVIITTAYADLDRAVSVFQSGAFDYLPKPFDIDDAVSMARRAVRRSDSTDASVAKKPGQVSGIVGAAPAMQEVFRAIGRLSRSHMTVLLTGESGTGKELVAKALHKHSPRANKAFIAINTAAIPRELLESELFGHERGAFTGATQQRIGRFEQADGGTLFLDEIGDMPAELQTRLLRVLADGEFYRVGGHAPVSGDVRIIAATHQDLQRRVGEGSFREDLYHRLNVIQIRIPPLRERRTDIRELCDFFLTATAAELAVEPKALTVEAEQTVTAYDWPGNVRQLQNVCRWVTVMAAGRRVHVDDLPPEVLMPTSEGRAQENGAGGDWEQVLKVWVQSRLAGGETGLLQQASRLFEQVMIETALQHTGGRRQEAARLLGWGRNTLTRKINELGLSDGDLPTEAG
jgi:two-component system nitrogen regulation response regulator GlnG